jgi:hypothetical protein
MTRLRPLLLLPLLAIAACQTQRKPLTGYATPPPGILLNQNEGPSLAIWPIFDLPPEEQIFRPRLNDQGTVIVTSDEGFYDYSEIYLSGWTGGWSQGLQGVPAGTYVVELDDDNGESWGKSAPLPVPAAVPFNVANPSPSQLPAVIFAHFGDQVGSWTIDPAMQDSDPATDEITVTNLIHEDVVVQRCLMTAAGPTSCTSVRTVSPGADLLTVETLTPAPATSSPTSSCADCYALFVQLASDASQSYERDLVQGTGTFGAGGTCQIERILVHGTRPITSYPPGSTAFAMSSCYGYASGS